MNILLANWTWFPSGGDWTYIESISKLYTAKGHNIIPFSVQNEKNISNDFEKFFLTPVDYKSYYDNLSIKSVYKLLTESVYSREAKEKLKLLLVENKVDIAQLNNINNYHTPSIIPVLKGAGIPIVWRILDYKLICPNNTFLSHNKICEKCYKHKYYHCILNKCKKNSFSASFLMTLESYFYYLMPYYRNVDMFMFQSNFTRDIFVRYGFDKNRSHVIENPFDCSSLTPSFTGKNYILYFGRISAEKGIMTLIQAMKFLPDMELQIVGNGPEYDPYLKYTFDNGIQNVKFLGPKWDKDLEPVLKNCDFVIVPSEWYDPSPYVVLQANAYGKPVIASRIGGLQDSVIDNETGVLFEPGNVLDLVDKITSLKNDRNLIMRLGRNARLLVESRNEPERYYNDTIGLFNNLT